MREKLKSHIKTTHKMLVQVKEAMTGQYIIA